MISDDLFRTSTQYRLFSYPSAQDLLAQRTKTNAHSRTQLPADASYLTVAEEIELIDYYVSKLWDLCRLFRVHSHVKATATAFLLRYYLHNTPLTTHPKFLILTTLFLAAKTENAFIPLDYFKQQLPSTVDSSQLTSLEFPLSSGLQFSYTVWSCLRPLWGFGLELVELVNEGALDFEKDEVRKVLDDARQWGSESLRTDAQFLFTPPQIALACLFHFNADLVRVFLGIKFPPGRILSPSKDPALEVAKQELEGGGAAETLLKTIMECDVLISERLDTIKERSKEYVTGIDKKLYKCKKLLDSQSAESSPPSDTAKRKSDVSDDNIRQPKKVKAE